MIEMLPYIICDDYKRYMHSVPRMNLLLGVVGLIRRKKKNGSV